MHDDGTSVYPGDIWNGVWLIDIGCIILDVFELVEEPGTHPRHKVELILDPWPNDQSQRVHCDLGDREMETIFVVDGGLFSNLEALLSDVQQELTMLTIAPLMVVDDGLNNGRTKGHYLNLAEGVCGDLLLYHFWRDYL